HVAMRIGVPRESFPDETRVALVPTHIPALIKAGHQVVVETGAGVRAGFPDDTYRNAGASVGTRQDVFASDVIAQVRSATANSVSGAAEIASLRRDQIVIGFAEPLTSGELTRRMAAQGVTSFSMELMPRITRAQSMDALSSMATVAGYKAVLLAADALPRMFPMLMTAAGTVAPAKVFIVGAGVAGLQAIATARRLGAKVEAFDVRPAVKEQVMSLGARFLELSLETAAAEDAGGYAKAQDESFYERQREMMLNVISGSDVVISTAAVPGKKAPILITEEMVRAMAAGSVIVDVAAERGGNCELTEPGASVTRHGVTILGPTNLAAQVPYHASQMYSKNLTTFFSHLAKSGAIAIDTDDEITRETLVTRGGEIVHERVRQALAS
ncbi:MAG TPA: Re/Si-specific NAD(P)(+) transhydrogenase subunit alpha, partial [Vicinamibacterales bacterium]|nr:Re/Si-specific NAD(P)(+) transhydrogenase subunit alpha [Vicinamibacterales bacterium]